MKTCKNCFATGNGNYCNNCGSIYLVKRISLSSITKEMVHTFSHFDKGFLFTLKQLLVRPGTMQRDYLDGQRSKNQKPFAMFFLCATLYGIAEYFILKPSAGSLNSENDRERMEFYRHYFIFLQSILVPVYAFILWILFKKKNFNYAEALVTLLYSLCIMLLLLIPINMVNLIPGHIAIPFIEIPLLSCYLIWTNINFFVEVNKLVIILKTILLLLFVEWISNSVMDFIISRHLLS